MGGQRKERLPVGFMGGSALSILILCFCVTAASAAGGEANPQRPAWVEQGVDRPGSDFQILWLLGGPEGCQAACAQHPQCRSYTYVRPGVPGRPEGCWLKNGIPPSVPDECCVSGVKTEEAFAGILRQPPVIFEEPVFPERAPQPAAIPEAPPAGIGREKEPARVTGAGMRIAAELRITAVPPTAARTFGAGAVRKMAKGIDFAAVPRSAPSSGPAPADGAKFPSTGKGLRSVAGVRYTATAPAATHPAPEVPLSGAATRTVRGVDISAVPPRR